MADKKISDLNALTAAAAGDLLIISDTSASETKKITFAKIKKDIGITEGANVLRYLPQMVLILHLQTIMEMVPMQMIHLYIF